jgi:hypothetical protein
VFTESDGGKEAVNEEEENAAIAEQRRKAERAKERAERKAKQEESAGIAANLMHLKETNK